MKKRIRSIVKIEPECGGTFEYPGVKAKCVEDDPHKPGQCGSCAFYGSRRCDTICCAAHGRDDDKHVHFIKVQQT